MLGTVGAGVGGGPVWACWATVCYGLNHPRHLCQKEPESLVCTSMLFHVFTDVLVIQILGAELDKPKDLYPQYLSCALKWRPTFVGPCSIAERLALLQPMQ